MRGDGKITVNYVERSIRTGTEGIRISGAAEEERILKLIQELLQGGNGK